MVYVGLRGLGEGWEKDRMCKTTHFIPNNKKIHSKKKSRCIYGEGKEIQALSRTCPSFPCEFNHLTMIGQNERLWFGKASFSYSLFIFSVSVQGASLR